jgi:hypothetical protein
MTAFFLCVCNIVLETGSGTSINESLFGEESLFHGVWPCRNETATCLTSKASLMELTVEVPCFFFLDFFKGGRTVCVCVSVCSYVANKCMEAASKSLGKSKTMVYAHVERFPYTLTTDTHTHTKLSIRPHRASEGFF